MIKVGFCPNRGERNQCSVSVELKVGIFQRWGSDVCFDKGGGLMFASTKVGVRCLLRQKWGCDVRLDKGGGVMFASTKVGV